MKNLRENTIDDIKDSIELLKMKRQLKNYKEKGTKIEVPGFKKGIDNGRVILGTPARNARLKRDAQIAGLTAGGLGIGAIALKVLSDRRRKTKWSKNGCGNIESKSERDLCLNYLEAKRLRRER